MVMTKERVLNKVQKLLSLANNNPNENESQAAMLQAQKLMASNNLSMTDVDVEEDNNRKEVVEKDSTEWTRLPWWQKMLASIIGDNFRCYSYMRAGGGKRKLVFLGTKEDVEIATEVFKFASSDIKYQSKKYLDIRGRGATRSMTNALKNDYISGYLSGLKTKFKEQVNKEGWGLILVKDDAVIERYENMGMRFESSRSRSSLGDSEAYGQGFKDGKSFSQGNRGIEG